MSDESKFMLESCPLCDDHPVLRPMVVYKNGEKSPAIIKCRACGISVASFDGDAAAVEKWNRRPQLERAHETIEAQNESYSQQFKELLDARSEIARLKERVADLEDKVSEYSQFGRWEK